MYTFFWPTFIYFSFDQLLFIYYTFPILTLQSFRSSAILRLIVAGQRDLAGPKFLAIISGSTRSSLPNQITRFIL